MYIKKIHIFEHRNLKNIELGPFSQSTEHSELIVLAGPNGSGKSSILELISLAIARIVNTAWYTSRSSLPDNHSFEIEIGLTNDELNLSKAFYHKTTPAYTEHPIDYLEKYGSYFLQLGRVPQERAKQNKLSQELLWVVSNALTERKRIQPGFFLSSDRFTRWQGLEGNNLNDLDTLREDHLVNNAFQTSYIQYVEMLKFLVSSRQDYISKLGTFHSNQKDGIADQLPIDPIEPYNELFNRLFSNYRLVNKPNATVHNNLFVRLASGEIIPFTDLSSGEKEVFLILSFFLRHSVQRSMILIDEPELHLHPELALRLISTLRQLQPGNQIWLATHNPEIINEASDDKTFYISRQSVTGDVTVIRGTDENEKIKQIRKLIGRSGFIGTKKTIFLEGNTSSPDRKVFIGLFPQWQNEIVFIPSESSDNLRRINAAILAILEGSFGSIEYYLIRDRDYFTDQLAKEYEAKSRGKIYVLKQHEIENYLLHDGLISNVLDDVFGKTINAIDVEQQLIKVAQRISGRVLRDMISFRLNLVYDPKDFSLGKILNDQPIIDTSGNLVQTHLIALEKHLNTKIITLNNELTTQTSPQAVTNLIADCSNTVQLAIKSGEWRSLFPGKELLQEFARFYGIDMIALRNSLIKGLASNPNYLASEISQVMQNIIDGKPLA